MADKCWKRSKSKSNLPKPIAFKPCCFLHVFAAWVLLKSSDQGWIGRERNLPGATGVAQKVGLAWLVASLHPWSVQLNYVEPMYLIWWHIIHQTQMAKTVFVQLVILAGHDIHAFSWIMLICWEIYLIKHLELRHFRLLHIAARLGPLSSAQSKPYHEIFEIRPSRAYHESLLLLAEVPLALARCWWYWLAIAWNFIGISTPWLVYKHFGRGSIPPRTPSACCHWHHIRQHLHPQHHCVFMQSSLPSYIAFFPYPWASSL